MTSDQILAENLTLFRDELFWHYTLINEDFNRSRKAEKPDADALAGKASFLVVAQSYLNHIDCILDGIEQRPEKWNTLSDENEIKFCTSLILKNTFNAVAEATQKDTFIEQAYEVAHSESDLISESQLTSGFKTALEWIEDTVNMSEQLIEENRKKIAGAEKAVQDAMQKNKPWVH